VAAIARSGRGIHTVSASIHTGTARCVDAVIQALDLGASASRTGDGGTHSRLVRAPGRTSLSGVALSGGSGEEVEHSLLSGLD